MSHELREGTALKSVFWAVGEIHVGGGGCESIVVAEQCGDMSMVPWAKAVINGETFLYNLAAAEGVSLAD